MPALFILDLSLKSQYFAKYAAYPAISRCCTKPSTGV